MWLKCPKAFQKAEEEAKAEAYDHEEGVEEAKVEEE